MINETVHVGQGHVPADRVSGRRYGRTGLYAVGSSCTRLPRARCALAMTRCDGSACHCEAGAHTGCGNLLPISCTRLVVPAPARRGRRALRRTATGGVEAHRFGHFSTGFACSPRCCFVGFSPIVGRGMSLTSPATMRGI